MCDPSNRIMERVPRTGLFMYHQSTSPVPPPDLPPVMAPVSSEPVSSVGPPPMVPAVVRHHVVPTHTAQMVLFAQAMCILPQVVQMWAVIIWRNACIYMRPDLRSRSGPLTSRSATWNGLPSLYFSSWPLVSEGALCYKVTFIWYRINLFSWNWIDWNRIRVDTHISCPCVRLPSWFLYLTSKLWINFGCYLKRCSLWQQGWNTISLTAIDRVYTRLITQLFH